MKLSDEDKRAVDLLLDLDVATNSNRIARTRLIAPVSHKRLAAVKQTLELLGQCPAIDPPKNLVQHTLQKIDSITGEQFDHLPQYPAPTISQNPPA